MCVCVCVCRKRILQNPSNSKLSACDINWKKWWENLTFIDWFISKKKFEGHKNKRINHTKTIYRIYLQCWKKDIEPPPPPPPPKKTMTTIKKHWDTSVKYQNHPHSQDTVKKKKT